MKHWAKVKQELDLGGTRLGTCVGPWQWYVSGQPSLPSINPATEEVLTTVEPASEKEYDLVIQAAGRAFETWSKMPAPKRGEIIRQLGEEFRKHKQALGTLISLETGKILSEGLGEVQEAIDICDYAVGLSRMLGGKTMPSERSEHTMQERWFPLGIVGVITAFNFPLAVWAWNAAIAAVCGNSMVWKPSPLTPLVAVAVQEICNKVMDRHSLCGVFTLVTGGEKIATCMAKDKRIAFVSVTGSTQAGRALAPITSDRFGKYLLELGGNNAVLVMDDANLDLAVDAIAFGAMGTAGQRCTTTRRVYAHKSISKELTARIVEVYKKNFSRIGDPLLPNTLIGPLIREDSVFKMGKAIQDALQQGGKLLCGGDRLAGKGYFVQPAIIKAWHPMPIVQEETFAPILYIMEADSIEDAVAKNNDVPQGLSSALFCYDVRKIEYFLHNVDTGIANINIGTSGAEIGGAFGGEKETGGGRESGSDSWKQYMRRQTSTCFYGDSEPEKAQGVKFE